MPTFAWTGGNSTLPLPSWSLEKDLAFMNESGIAAAILSVSSPGLAYGPLANASGLARQVCQTQHQLVLALHFER